ncbi:MAG: PQQ-dependent sugar dehydrogenase [Phycisphaera sp.]|nr:MAG: PQQ-dependent sugar dehydrogenase [Phycisphaera sp.]
MAQAPDPLPSSTVLELSTFATISTIDRSGAIDLDAPRDGSGRVFVSTNEGKVFIFSAAGDPLGVFLDLAAPGVLPDFRQIFRLSTNGLSYSAFHPDYAVPGTAGEGKFYTTSMSVRPGSRAPDYSGAALPSRPGDSRAQYAITEWTVDASDPNRIDTTSRREVIRFEFSGRVVDSHSVGQLMFDPYAEPGDANYGLLHIPLGDMNNGSGNPGWQHVQDRDNPFGKILRIDPLQNGTDRYSVPASNFYADGGPLLDDDGNTEEIFAWGMRNPQNMCFARDALGNGRLLVFDIGDEKFEEINIVDNGDNHGWTRYDGPDDGNLGTVLRLPSGSTLEFPAAVYDHEIPNTPGATPTAENTAIVGGFPVIDPSDPGFGEQVLFSDLARGAFFHADLGELFAADAGDTQADVFVMNVSVDGSTPGGINDILGLDRVDPRFGSDESGRVFVVSRQVDTVWVADLVIDEAELCVANCDGDGSLTLFDFLCFQNAFDAGDPRADCDGDGSLTLFDFLCFQNAFDAGCG